VLNLASLFLGAPEVTAAARANNVRKTGRSMVTVAEACEEMANAKRVASGI